MAKTDRDQMPFRLAPDVMRRLDRAARRRGQTRQAFVEGAVLAELAADEERRLMFTKDETPSESVRPSSSPPTSLLTQALMQRRQADEPVAPSATIGTPQGQVVVNVGNGSGAPGSDIERLAVYVANGGNDLERETRLRTAVGILHASSSTDEERKVLAARLDEAVATKTKAAPSNDGAGGIVRTARIAYDKIADLWEKM